jgi:LDH2 family malate/lactate/ureidoglycolate dehydrogenase
MPALSADLLCNLTTALFAAVGTNPETSAFIANSLVASDLAGHASHGVIRCPQYLEVVALGAIDPTAEPEIVSIDGATVKIDAKFGWGQPAMQLATIETIALARLYGIAIGVVENAYHIGRVAPYVERAAVDGMIALATANVGPGVAPYGGRTRVLGTNPLAWALPGEDEAHPYAFDIATSQIAEGKARVALTKGLPVPLGSIVDLEGNPSTDPADLYDGGALTTFGAHKGSGMSILGQMLGRGLAGATSERLLERHGGNGAVLIVIDPSRFSPLESFRAAASEEAARVRSAVPAEGFTEVLMPGDREVREGQRREVEGCEIDDVTWEKLVSDARRFGLPESLWATEA